MMIDKRLIRTVRESKKYIAWNVIYQWISLVANITMMVSIADLLSRLFANTADRENFVCTVIVVAAAVGIRYFCAVQSAKMGYLSSKAVKKVLREKIYRKLLRLGSSYKEKAQTSEIVQISVEGVEQLETYFGAYLPQFFYAMLAPLTLFIVLGFTDSNLNHTGIYLYSKGKIMIHLTFDYKTDEKCTTPGQYLKYHRTFQGLSTRELAEKVGIVPATLVLYENDRHPIKYSTAVALANVLGIDRNRLLDEYTAFVDYPYFSLLKKVRQDLSLTQIQMAELIGIGQTSYSGWEREIRVPRRKEYDKILAALKKLKVNVDTYLCQSASI